MVRGECARAWGEQIVSHHIYNNIAKHYDAAFAVNIHMCVYMYI